MTIKRVTVRRKRQWNWARVWNRTRFDDVPCAQKVVPDELDAYPLVILANDESAVIGINPKKGYVLLRNGLKTEPSDMQGLLDKYLTISISEARGWEKEFVKDLKRRKRPDQYEDSLEFKMIQQVVADGRKDIEWIADGIPLDKFGYRVTDWEYTPFKSYVDCDGVK